MPRAIGGHIFGSSRWEGYEREIWETKGTGRTSLEEKPETVAMDKKLERVMVEKDRQGIPCRGDKRAKMKSMVYHLCCSP